MAPSRWLALPGLVFLGAALAASCSNVMVLSGTSSSGSGGSGGVGGAAEAGGAGGAGGAPMVTSSSAGTGGMPEAGPILCPDHSYSNIKLKGECDLLQQDCGPGRSCRPYFDNKWTTKCFEADGLKGEGEVCYIDDECLASLTCAAGRCAPICCGKNNEPCKGGTCNLHISIDGNGTFTQVCHYAKQCDLLAPNACPLGFGCHIESIPEGLATCSQPSGAKAPDLGSCTYLNDCADMAGCYPPGIGGQCHYYCYLDQANPASPPPGLGGCPKGEVCGMTANGQFLDLGIDNIGLCAPGAASSSSSSGGMSDAGPG